MFSRCLKSQLSNCCVVQTFGPNSSCFLFLPQDTFVIVFSLGTGRVLYASEQAPSILNCKRKFLDSAKFVELLFHQDVNVFYSHTAQPHLPPWNVGTGSGECIK